MKRTENEAKNDKTEHGMEEREKDKVKIKVKVQKVKVKVNPDKVKDEIANMGHYKAGIIVVGGVESDSARRNVEQKPGLLAVLRYWREEWERKAARLGCAETKFATWDDLAFKLIILGWNVKHSNFAKR
ncbi:hypothetical protein Tco_0959018 [Tanacetum coccineum]